MSDGACVRRGRNYKMRPAGHGFTIRRRFRTSHPSPRGYPQDIMRGILFLALFLSAARCPGEAAPRPSATAQPPVSSNRSTPGVEVAQAISTITGVAISPLMGVSGVGAWKYYHTPPAQRTKLPWYAQPWFWGPAILVVLL